MTFEEARDKLKRIHTLKTKARDVAADINECKNNIEALTLHSALSGVLKIDGEKETDFFGCIAWRALAESVGKYVHKGDKICVVGQLQNRQYEDKEGNKRIVAEILAESRRKRRRAANLRSYKRYRLQMDIRPKNKKQVGDKENE